MTADREINEGLLFRSVRETLAIGLVREVMIFVLSDVGPTNDLSAVQLETTCRKRVSVEVEPIVVWTTVWIDAVAIAVKPIRRRPKLPGVDGPA